MTPDHAAKRRLVVGASEVASVLGLSSTPPVAQVLRSKIDPNYQWEGNDSTAMGTALEPGLRELAARHLGCRISLADWIAHPTLPYVGASPDGLCVYPDGRQRNCEIKVIGRHSPTYAEWGDEGTDQIPQGYLCQAQVQMACTGFAETDVVALVAGELRCYVVRYDAELATMLCQGANDWYVRHVVNGEPLPPDSTDAYAELLAHKFPRDNGQTVLGDERAAEVVARWRDHREARLAAEKGEAEARAELLTIMGSASHLQTHVGVVSYKSQASAARTDWKALVEAQKISQEVVESFTARGSHRVLRLKGSK